MFHLHNCTNVENQWQTVTRDNQSLVQEPKHEHLKANHAAIQTSQIYKNTRRSTDVQQDHKKKSGS